jgi:hypothetical protein
VDTLEKIYEEVMKKYKLRNPRNYSGIP